MLFTNFIFNPVMYIDPSVMTYAIQAIAGIVIAVGAIVGIYYRRAKKKVAETLNIEERSKETEEDLVVFDEKEEK